MIYNLEQSTIVVVRHRILLQYFSEVNASIWRLNLSCSIYSAFIYTIYFQKFWNDSNLKTC